MMVGWRLSLLWLSVFCIIALLLPLIVPLDPFQPVDEPLKSPSDYPPLGTDALGRDFMSRLILGSRMTLGASFLATVITIASGLTLAVIASMSKGIFDRLIMAMINASLAIPGLLFAFLLTASMGAGFRTVILAIGFGLAPGYARLARTVLIQVRQEEYITAARSIGMRPLRIGFRHLLPNAIRGVASFSALHFSWSILGITTLTFLGLSGDPSIPELGTLLNAGRLHLQGTPHLSIFPGILISLTVLAIYRFSEGRS
jgi:ABC-type dipeptide/oligopeptide/nickel transport system permease subunit